MKAIYLLVLSFVAASFVGCTDQKAVEEKARADADAKVRAEAARKEMEAVPKVFRPQYHNKRLEPDPKTQTGTGITQPAESSRKQ